MTKVALVGFDGISWKVLQSYSQYFKNTLQLALGGKRGVNWCVPPYTPRSWTSISTGIDPRKHNILGFGVPNFRGHSEYEFLSSYDVHYPRLTELLGMCGLRSIVINHTLSYPPSGCYLGNQVLVSDDKSPRCFVYPKSFEWRLRHFEMNGSVKPTSTDDKWVVDLAEATRNRIEGMLKLIRMIDPDFLWVVFTESDRIMHFLEFVSAGVRNERVGRLFCDDEMERSY